MGLWDDEDEDEAVETGNCKRVNSHAHRHDSPVTVENSWPLFSDLLTAVFLSSSDEIFVALELQPRWLRLVLASNFFFHV